MSSLPSISRTEEAPAAASSAGSTARVITSICIFLFLSLGLFLVLSISIVGPYDRLDHLRMFAHGFEPPLSILACMGLWSDFLWSTGRPLQAFYECTEQSLVWSLSEIWYSRLLNVAILSAVGTTLARFMISMGARPTETTLFSLAAILTPGFCSLAIAGGVGTSVLLPVLLASAGAKAMENITDFRQLLVPSSIPRGFFSLAMLLIALFSYQPAAFFFLVFSALRLIFAPVSNFPHLYRKTIFDLCFLGAVCLLYLFAVKAGAYAFVPPNYLQQADLGQYKITFSDPGFYLGKFWLLVSQRVPDLLNFWNIYSETIWSWIGAACIALGAIAGLVNGGYSSSGRLFSGLSRWPAYIRFGLLVLVTLSVNATWLLSKSIGDATHFFFSTSVILLALIWHSIRNILDAFGRIMGLNVKNSPLIAALILAVPALVVMAVTMGRDAVNSILEVNYVKTEFVRYLRRGPISLTHVHVIRHRGERTFLGDRRRYGEFNEASSGANPAHIKELTTAALIDLFRALSLRPLKVVDCRDNPNCLTEYRGKKDGPYLVVTQSEPGEPYAKDINTLVIDMTVLTRASGARKEEFGGLSSTP